jgi:hypothetical protein
VRLLLSTTLRVCLGVVVGGLSTQTHKTHAPHENKTKHSLLLVAYARLRPRPIDKQVDLRAAQRELDGIKLELTRPPDKDRVDKITCYRKVTAASQLVESEVGLRLQLALEELAKQGGKFSDDAKEARIEERCAINGLGWLFACL